jgi:hypothetical protein
MKYPMNKRVEVETTATRKFVIMNCGSVKYLETYDLEGNKVCMQGFSTIKKCLEAIETHKKN